MAEDNDKMKYYVNTYSQFSHNHVIAILSSNECQYRFEYLQTEQTYSRFEVYSNMETFRSFREMIDQNDGTAISIEHGTY